eukprot:TRINITY_DN26983_c0_g1_i2.p1 TRINITY_DN26983_c0_g1~~TRINITY_DN26983_c0_g1_i2.p1  ORF type:complete len:405 (+),score=13.98 TRINITY_DN26983_c0_g1_i2:60-1274(+)
MQTIVIVFVPLFLLLTCLCRRFPDDAVTDPVIVDYSLADVGGQQRKDDTRQMHRMEKEGIQASLTASGFPHGLADLISESDCRIGLRMFILDNSASTQLRGGLRIPDRDPLTMKPTARASRWEEIADFALRQTVDTVSFHEFVSTSPLTVLHTWRPCDGCGSGCKQEFAKKLHEMPSTGETPLAAAVRVVRDRMDTQYKHISGKIVVVATDSQPNDFPSFVQALQTLRREHNVRVVIRITARTPDLVRAYVELDKQLSFRYDVIDGMENEAREVYDVGNTFFVYSPLLHFTRARGTEVRIFDSIDRKLLSDEDAMTLVDSLLRKNENDPPLVREPRSEFMNQVKARIEDADLVYDPIAMCMAKPVNFVALQNFLGVLEFTEGGLDKNGFEQDSSDNDAPVKEPF